MKKYNDLHTACSQAIKIGPDNPTALYNLAIAKLNIGRAMEAMPLLDQALRYGADEATILIAHGDCNISLQKFSSGIELYQKALAILYNDDPNALYKIARAYALQNKASEGMTWLEKAIKNGVDLQLVKTDPDIGSLRKTDGYSRLKQEYGF